MLPLLGTGPASPQALTQVQNSTPKTGMGEKFSSPAGESLSLAEEASPFFKLLDSLPLANEELQDSNPIESLNKKQENKDELDKLFALLRNQTPTDNKEEKEQIEKLIAKLSEKLEAKLGQISSSWDEKTSNRAQEILKLKGNNQKKTTENILSEMEARLFAGQWMQMVQKQMKQNQGTAASPQQNLTTPITALQTKTGLSSLFSNSSLNDKELLANQPWTPIDSKQIESASENFKQIEGSLLEKFQNQINSLAPSQSNETKKISLSSKTQEISQDTKSNQLFSSMEIKSLEIQPNNNIPLSQQQIDIAKFLEKFEKLPLSQQEKVLSILKNPGENLDQKMNPANPTLISLAQERKVETQRINTEDISQNKNTSQNQTNSLLPMQVSPHFLQEKIKANQENILKLVNQYEAQEEKTPQEVLNDFQNYLQTEEESQVAKETQGATETLPHTHISDLKSHDSKEHGIITNHKADGESTTAPVLASHVVKKVLDMSAQLQATHGGRARFHIEDTKLGKIHFQVEVKANNVVTISIQAERESVRKSIEDKSDILKQSLEMQKLHLTEFKVTSADKPTNAQSQFSGSQQQDQQNQYANQTNMNFQQSLNQSGKEEQKQNIFSDEIVQTSQSKKPYKNVEKNSITNIQRGANGSIKVSA